MIRGAALVNVEVGGEIKNLRVNGVDVVPLAEAELDRRCPDRVKCGRSMPVRQVLADLTDAKLTGMTEPVTETGYPEPESFPVRRYLRMS